MFQVQRAFVEMHGHCVFDLLDCVFNLHMVRQVAAHGPRRRSPNGDVGSDAAQRAKVDSAYRSRDAVRDPCLAVAQLLHAVLALRAGVGLRQAKAPDLLALACLGAGRKR